MLASVFERMEAGVQLYALADAACMAHPTHMIEAYGLSSHDLFAPARARLGDEADLSPLLIEIPGPNFYGDDYIESTVSEGDAILLESKLEPKPLRRHLKRFTKEVINGRACYVKFYRGANFEFCLTAMPRLAAIFEHCAAVHVPDETRVDLTRRITARSEG